MGLNRDTSVSKSAPNVPSVQNFLRRNFHASVAPGDFVYIDGGEVQQLPAVNGGPTGKLLNVTLAIDMRKSWSNDTVTFNSIGKNGAPSLNTEVLWPSTDNQTFFASGGLISYWDLGAEVPDVSCWQFTADGNGGGSWAIFKPVDQSIFYDLTRPGYASGATVDNTGFIFGGHASYRSSPQTSQLRENVPIPGIVSFNITSTLWQNDTLRRPDIQDLNAPQGMLASVDSFGTDGLLVQAGLTSDANGVMYNADAEPYESPAVVKAWYAANGPSTRTWNSPAVQRLFLQESSSTGGTGTSPSSPEKSEGTGTSTSSPEKSGSSSTGAIVEGVVGGISASCLLIGLAWWLCRRKRRASDGIGKDPTPEQQTHQDHQQSELETVSA
ncbi:MAG: hypothetical protein Q9199_004874 [Rusavskia elegans]